MTRNQKPTVLILTSSFPSSVSDETCGYIRDFARSLAAARETAGIPPTAVDGIFTPQEFDVTVLAPPDRYATQWPADSFTLVRSRSVVPVTLDPFQARNDLNRLTRASALAKVAACLSLLCFLARAFVLGSRADVICSHWMVPCGLIGALISRLLGKKHVVIEHSGAVHLLRRVRGGRVIARLIVDSSARMVTVSADLKHKLVGLCPSAESKTDVITMGTDTNNIPARGDNGTQLRRRRILFVGRLVEVKGLDVLLKAMSGLDVMLMVAGDGERRSDLERLSRDLRVNATFVGSIDALLRSELFAACDAVVVPSRALEDGRTEGMPVVCLEAMAAGCVVIASRVGGLAEVIVDGQNGFLFEAENHQMLRDKLMLVLGDDSLRKRISENARCTVEGYDWSEVGARFAEIMFSSMSHRSSLVAGDDRKLQSRRDDLSIAGTWATRCSSARSDLFVQPGYTAGSRSLLAELQ